MAVGGVYLGLNLLIWSDAFFFWQWRSVSFSGWPCLSDDPSVFLSQHASVVSKCVCCMNNHSLSQKCKRLSFCTCNMSARTETVKRKQCAKLSKKTDTKANSAERKYHKRQTASLLCALQTRYSVLFIAK